MLNPVMSLKAFSLSAVSEFLILNQNHSMSPGGLTPDDFTRT